MLCASKILTCSLGKCSNLKFHSEYDEYSIQNIILHSWDPQASGLGYIIERGVNGAETLSAEGFLLETLDMARLLGRTPSDRSRAAFFGKQQPPESKSGEEKDDKVEEKKTEEKTWRGSGLGSDWDDKVGAGAAAASIVSNFMLEPMEIVLSALTIFSS